MMNRIRRWWYIRPWRRPFHTHDHDTGRRISHWGIDYDRSHHDR